jgi:hypothetical protein
MAYWSGTKFDYYAAEDDLRNVKPRWQELAEIYSTPSSTFPTATSPKVNRNIGHMDRRTPAYDNGDNGLCSERLRANDSNVASLGASRSRSRSRSRPSRPRTRMFENSAASTQHRSKTTANRRYQHTHSKQRMLVSLLALVIALLSWFSVPAVRSLSLNGISLSNAVWIQQNVSFVAEVRDDVCKIPLVTKVLDCGQLSDSEASRDNSNRYTIPGIVFALSESPDTVDEILDILEDIKKDLFAIQESTMEASAIPIDHLLNLTSVLETNLLDWENGKDNLLDTIQTKISPLKPNHKYQARKYMRSMARTKEDAKSPAEDL